MSKTPWTPGPWRIESGLIQPSGTFEVWSHSWEIALLSDGAGDEPPAVRAIEDRAEANARLITAAPEMAELLERAIGPYDGFSGDEINRRNRLGAYDDEKTAQIFKIRALLARIKGETP